MYIYHLYLSKSEQAGLNCEDNECISNPNSNPKNSPNNHSHSVCIHNHDRIKGGVSKWLWLILNENIGISIFFSYQRVSRLTCIVKRMAASLSWKIYVYVTVALALAFTTDADTDVMLGHRKHVPGYSLGPAPFPDFKDMDYELFQDAFLRDDSVKVTDAEQVRLCFFVRVMHGGL